MKTDDPHDTVNAGLPEVTPPLIRTILTATAGCVVAGLFALFWQPGLSADQLPSATVASMRVEGRLVRIQGRYYIIEDNQGKEVYLMVGHDTELAGTFKIGDRIEVLTSPVEHAIAIRAALPEQESPVIDTATRSITGKLIAIEGRYYVMLDREGKEVRLLVNQDTELAGEFSAGDQIEVFTSPIEHAVAIKAAP